MSDRAYPSYPIPGVGAVVLGSDGVLLVRRDKEPGKGFWSVPGGAVEVGETQVDAVIREVLEETGVQVEVIRLIDTADVIFKDEAGEVEFHFLLNHYLARGLTFETRPERPSAEVRWFRFDNLPIDEMPKQIYDLVRSQEAELDK